MKSCIEEDENCGHCIHHRKNDGCWICTNPDSECYGCYTEYTDTCEEFDERSPFNKFRVEVKK